MATQYKRLHTQDAHWSGQARIQGLLIKKWRKHGPRRVTHCQKWGTYMANLQLIGALPSVFGYTVFPQHIWVSESKALSPPQHCFLPNMVMASRPQQLCDKLSYNCFPPETKQIISI